MLRYRSTWEFERTLEKSGETLLDHCFVLRFRNNTLTRTSFLEYFILTNNSNRNGCVRARPLSCGGLHLDVIFYNITGSLFRILDKNK